MPEYIITGFRVDGVISEDTTSAFEADKFVDEFTKDGYRDITVMRDGGEIPVESLADFAWKEMSK